MFNFIVGAIIVLWVLSKIGNMMIDIQGDWNRASQHKRDREILDAIKDLKDKE